MNPNEDELELEEEDDDEEELDDQVTPDTEQEPETPEKKNERLERELAEKDRDLTAARAAADALKSLREVEPRREEGAPPRRELTAEETEKINADLGVRLATDPLSVLRAVKEEAKREAAEELRRDSSPMAEAASEAIIERFERQAKKENPVIGEKVAVVFRETLDKIPASEKAKLIGVSPEKQKEILGLHWDASAGKYLAPLARPKVRPLSGGDTGGRTLEGVPTRREKGFHFSQSQREAMKRAGMADDKIAAREKSIREGLAS